MISNALLFLSTLVSVSALPTNDKSVAAKKPQTNQIALNEISDTSEVVFENESSQWTHFNNYSDAFRAAQIVNQPLLVILNPADNEETDSISIEDVRKTRQRRKLLTDYVVAVIDTGTEHGKECHKIFGEDPLPHVVVIDKKQKYQMFQTSEELYGQLWTQILLSNRDGEYRPPQVRPVTRVQSQGPSYPVYSHCPT